MTIKQARKLLGPLAKDVSDEQLQKDLHIAELFKNVFFSSYADKKGLTAYNTKMP